MIRRAAAVAGLLLVVAAPATAAVPRVPMELPGTARAAADDATPESWILGIGAGPAARAIVRAHGGTPVAGRAWELPRERAAAAAAALRRRGLLDYAEPDRTARRAQAPAPDPLSPAARWRDAVVAPDLAAPPVTPGSPVLALIDSPLDASHPEFAGGNVTGLPGPAVNDFHGTATAAVAAAPANGTGILGVWPGMRAVNLPLPSEISCTDSARQIAEAVRRRVSVINMSYSASRPCFAEYEQLQRATASGVALVAAAGNEFEAGNEPQYPASLPHVVTVTAVGADLRSSYFSNANAAVDLAAPGEGILTAVPLDHDPDDPRDGYAVLDGTSFAAPIVAAALTWVRAARPRLSVDQAVQVVRLSARDLDREGYDANTGFGLLQVGAALTAPAPARDPGEPNEDIRWIDGSRVRGNERPLYRSGRSATVTAVADRYEDPRDVYRVVVPARGRLALELRPRFGDVDLFAHDLRASTVAGRRYRLGASTRDGTRTDTLTIANRTAVARTAWVTVAIDDGARALDARYTLRVTRR